MTLISTIQQTLDQYFEIHRFPPDSPFSTWLPRVYEGSGFDLRDYFQHQFLELGHGLMSHNSAEVSQINTVVFLSDEIVDKAVNHTQESQLLISHHPLDFETCRRGFLPLSQDRLDRMRDHRISVYILHTPLDVHSQLSTGLAWARQLSLEAVVPYSFNEVGPFGVRGRLAEECKFESLLEKVANISGVSDPHFIKRKETVRDIGILAGGTDPQSILLSEQEGCDVVITGTYYNLVQNDIGEEHRRLFESMKNELTISLVECSHYGSEAVVMRHDILDFCRRTFGIEGSFISQDDPWH